MSNLGTMQSWMSIVLSEQLTYTQLQVLLNKADTEEVESWSWARLKARTTINSFAAMTSLSLTVTQGSPTVTINTGTFPAVTAQFALTIGGQQYAPMGVVANAAPSTTLTLTTPYPAPSSGTATGTLFQLYYSVPNWQEIVAVKQQINLTPMTEEQLDDIDPYLNEIGSPSLNFIPAGRDVNDNVQFILWPIETSANGYVVRGLRSHVDMVNPTDLPSIPSAVIVAKSLAESCETLYTLRGDLVWSDMRDYYRRIYEDELIRARERDKNQYGVIAQIRDWRQVQPGLDVVPFRDGQTWE